MINSKHKYPIILSFFLAGSIVYCLGQLNGHPLDQKTNYETPPKAIRLKSVRVFPDERDEKHDIFLGQVQSFSADDMGNFYLPDNRNDEVLIFSDEGKYLRRFGRSGQGPGEFLRPTGIACGPNNVLVSESQNMRMQLFSTTGEYISGFRMFKYLNPFLVNKNIIIASMSHSRPPADMNSSLISVLDMEGRVLKYFGASINAPLGDYQNSNKTCLAMTANGQLIVAFMVFPIIRLYSLDGTLIREFTTKSPVIDNLSPINKEALKTLESNDRARRFMLCCGVFANKDGIYLLVATNDRIEILLLDEFGRTIKYYYKDLTTSLGCQGLIVKNKLDSIHFYVLRYLPQDAIEEFIPIK